MNGCNLRTLPLSALVSLALAGCVNPFPSDAGTTTPPDSITVFTSDIYMYELATGSGNLTTPDPFHIAEADRIWRGECHIQLIGSALGNLMRSLIGPDTTGAQVFLGDEFYSDTPRVNFGLLDFARVQTFPGNGEGTHFFYSNDVIVDGTPFAVGIALTATPPTNPAETNFSAVEPVFGGGDDKVLAHELGHTLGVEHDTINTDALMFPMLIFLSDRIRGFQTGSTAPDNDSECFRARTRGDFQGIFRDDIQNDPPHQ